MTIRSVPGFISALRHCLPAYLIGCFSLLASPAIWAADDWSQEGRDATAGSLNGEQSVLNAGNLDQLVKLWARDLDVWEQSTAVVVGDGQAFVGRKVSDPKKTVQQQLVRLDMDTGKIVWQADLPDGITTPALTATTVIAAGDGTGTQRDVTHVAAFDRATGERRWLYRHPEATLFTAPHVLDGSVYLVGFDGSAVSLDAQTGALRWRRHLPGSDCCSTHGLAAADGVVIVSRNSGLIAVDAADGHTLWRYDMPDFQLVNERPMIVNGTALMFDLNGLVHAFDLSTGAVRWVTPTHAGKDYRSSGPLATDGRRVFALSGVVATWATAIDLDTGATLWNMHLPKWTHSPILSNGVLYLARSKHLLALDPATGANLPIARLPSMAYDHGELSIAEGHLFMSGGPVRAYGLPNAQPAAKRAP
jgi:outer membrane protein assembly factor BamB